MTKLSEIRGFGASGSGGGGDSGYTGANPVLDSYSTNLQDAGYNFAVTNLDAYAQAIRIRGLDTSTKAYFGMQMMTRASSTYSSGNAAHTFVLFSVNQTTGAITRENVTNVYQTSQQNDYSTFSRCSDEWTGRYCYSGNIPNSGSTGHNYGYDAVLIYNTSGSSSSSRSQNNNYMPASNGSKINYVAPNERRIGGAVTQSMNMYDSSSKACMNEFSFNYSASSLNMQSSQSRPFSTSTTSTNYEVNIFWQWDPSYTQPYYSDFGSFSEGMYAKVRTSGSWTNAKSTFSLNQSSWAFHLSSGNMVFYYGGTYYKIDTSGTWTELTDGSQPLSLARAGSRKAVTFCWNIGQDEWLQHYPGGKFMKFKFDPNTCVVTSSNTMEVSSLTGYDSYYQYKTGLFSSFALSTINYSSQMFTFGNENSNGPGYGQKKLIWMGASNSDDKIYVKSYDMTNIISQLVYS
jgi:hypothetical protein